MHEGLLSIGQWITLRCEQAHDTTARAVEVRCAHLPTFAVMRATDWTMATNTRLGALTWCSVRCL